MGGAPVRQGTSTWPLLVCDSCGLPVRSPDQGWLEWLRHSEGGRAYGFRVCHKDLGECHAYNISRGGCGAPLSGLQGDHGVLALLGILEAERAVRTPWCRIFARLWRSGLFHA